MSTLYRTYDLHSDLIETLWNVKLKVEVTNTEDNPI